jgi:hypothetical protein
VTANQVSYSSSVAYNSGTVGYAINGIEDSMDNINVIAS